MDRLLDRSGAVRSEAIIQADVRNLLLDPYLGLRDVQLETQVGDRRRIDVEVGCTVIEVKRTLATPSAVTGALGQLTDYVSTRSTETGQRYVGILTDGKLWIAYSEVCGALREATRISPSGGEVGAVELLRWLEGALATRHSVPPTPNEITAQLGASSSSHALDFSTLSALYDEGRHLPTVRLKRELWAKLLRGALGTQFADDDQLFLEHTLLVNSAEIIAHLVLGVKAQELSPATLLSGDQFAIAGLYGVVDRDFFDWVLEVPSGPGYVAALARRLARFEWAAVEHDVLKVLYESVISTETRKALGEYYTPDWLASRMVDEVVTDPLNQRLLDPSCGSGTFLFYAVRRYLEAAEAAAQGLAQALDGLSSHVMGIDLHPVAVALARVTYLLAIGRDRLNSPRGTLSVPVYLGDSLGWDQRENLLTVDWLVIPTETDDKLLTGELRFPERLLADSKRFDDIVLALVDESGRAAGKKTTRLSEGTIRRLALDQEDLPTLNENFARLKELHEEGRDHIWSYYIRNVSRPAWLARDENRVDVLVGNPPWLSYRHMTAAMQKQFKSLATDRNFWHTQTTATHQDLAGLFIARAAERYLKTGGKMAFVVPNPVLDRDYWSGFRQGQFDGANVAFSASWDLRRIRPHLFPRGSGVVFATRALEAVAMPATALIWSGRAPHRHDHIDTTTQLRYALGQLVVDDGGGERSPYATRFSQGASLAPRVFWRVEDAPTSGLGVPAGRQSVRSKRSASEKVPWKGLPALSGTVESEFVWPTLPGEAIVPFRLRTLERFVLPLTQGGALLGGDSAKIDAYPGLATWMREAERLWQAHGTSTVALIDWIDHMGKLTSQIPITQPRVVYSKAGMHVAAALLTDRRPVIDTTCYWAAVSSLDEGHYLVGILNAPILTDLVRPLMSYGKDERHIDKAVWKLPIPTYDPGNELHTEIARLARQLTKDIAALEFRSDYFVTIRRDIRAHLVTSKTGQQLNGLVSALLNVPAKAEEADESEADQPAASDVRLIRTTSHALPNLTPDTSIDVDCEFDRNGTVYLWGALVSHGSGEAASYHSFGQPAADIDEVDLATQFATWLAGQIKDATSRGESVQWYHYGFVEQRHLGRILGPSIAPIQSLGIDVLAQVIRPNFYAPLGYGLKKLGYAAGARWHDEGATGSDTLSWFDSARAGDSEAWNRLLTYNEGDTRALMRLRHHLTGLTSLGSTLSG